MDLFTPLFCDIDDFCQFFEPQWKQYQFASLERERNRGSSFAIRGTDADCVVSRFRLPQLQELLNGA
jgi:hypothetical protein